jgi:hypothetical protein
MVSNNSLTKSGPVVERALNLPALLQKKSHFLLAREKSKAYQFFLSPNSSKHCGTTSSNSRPRRDVVAKAIMIHGAKKEINRRGTVYRAPL